MCMHEKKWERVRLNRVYFRSTFQFYFCTKFHDVYEGFEGNKKERHEDQGNIDFLDWTSIWLDALNIVSRSFERIKAETPLNVKVVHRRRRMCLYLFFFFLIFFIVFILSLLLSPFSSKESDKNQFWYRIT